MATFGSSGTLDKNGDKKGIPVGQGIPSAYGYAPMSGYPSAPTGPLMPPAYPGYPTGAAYPYPQGPPPPYSVAVSQPSTVPGYPTSFGYPYGIPVCTPPLLTHAPATVVMPGGFDGGARFDGISRPVVPPPPPGVIPNAAQLAMLQGNPAVVTQQKESFLNGASGGGYTFW